MGGYYKGQVSYKPTGATKYYLRKILYFSNMEASFKVHVNLFDDRNVQELLIIPNQEGIYMVVLDGVELTQMQHDGEDWIQVEGNLDKESIQKITDSIDRYYL